MKILIGVLAALAVSYPTAALAWHSHNQHSHVTPQRCGDRPPIEQVADA